MEMTLTMTREQAIESGWLPEPGSAWDRMEKDWLKLVATNAAPTEAVNQKSLFRKPRVARHAKPQAVYRHRSQRRHRR